MPSQTCYDGARGARESNPLEDQTVLAKKASLANTSDASEHRDAGQLEDRRFTI